MMETYRLKFFEKQISELGWTLCEPFTGKFCAFCRHFYTPQRNTPEEVLADVRAEQKRQTKIKMETNPEFVIESNIPVPTDNYSSHKYPFDKLTVGDSFFLPANGNSTATTTRLRTAACNYAKRYSVSLAVRKVAGGARCWRIK